jgi:hypothetical protein
MSRSYILEVKSVEDIAQTGFLSHGLILTIFSHYILVVFLQLR